MPRWLADFEVSRRGGSTVWALAICIALACLTAGILLLTLPSALATHSSKYLVDYGIMIDAGSSGSRVFLYSWPRRQSSKMPVVSSLLNPQTNTSLVLKVLPGLQSYQSNYTAAGLSLKPLIEFAMSNLPEDRLADTPVFLEATAGLRKLPTEVSTGLINACRAYLKTTPFKFRDNWVRVIPGEEEAINGWMTVNLLSGTLGGPPDNAIGTVEVGGASLQVAFIPSSPPPANQSWPLSINGEEYNVYVESYMYYGLTEAKYRLNESLWDTGGKENQTTVSNPCFLSGFTEDVQFLDASGTYEEYELVGTGDFDACAESSIALLNLTVPCADPPCLWNGVHQPPRRGLFHGIDNFSKALIFYNLSNNYTPLQLAEVGRSFCSMPWANASAKWPSTPAPLKDYCFMAAYLYVVLTAGFDIAADDNTTFDYSSYINNTEVSWTYGAMTLQVMNLPWRQSWFASASHLLALLLPPIFILCIALAIVWLCRRRKQETSRSDYEPLPTP